MAFGKKKSPDEQLPAEAGIEPASAPGGAIEGSMFAAPAADGEPPADLAATVGEPESAADTPVADAPVADAPVAEAVPEPAPAGGDPLAGGADLLSMFQTTQIESDDRTALLDLAGEVEIDDLIEELQTVASAMGIRVAQ